MEKPLTRHINVAEGPPGLKQYEKTGGYTGLRKALLSMSPMDVQEVVKQSGLRGRGGAGFPTGMKWSFVPMGPEARRPKYFIVNADEMEPGAFKDRYLLEGNPHQVIEGVVIGAYAIEAEQAYIFLRWAYKTAQKRLEKAIDEARAAGYIGRNILGSGFSIDVRIHAGAGRYICGEETALLNSLEGKRAVPRTKPPFPQISGLWGRPTIVNNVETVCNIPHIIANGARWFQRLSRSSDSGTKLYGASGRLRRPGLWELPMGVTMREIIEEYAGGMQDGYVLRGVIPGGASTDFLGPEHMEVKMDFDSVSKAGSRLGTGTMIILDDRTCPVGMVHNMIRFFSHESCGWCTPCREGLSWAEKILRSMENGGGLEGDIERLHSITRMLGIGNTFCALAPGAMEPLQSGLIRFREDFERHIREGRCPWRK